MMLCQETGFPTRSPVRLTCMQRVRSLKSFVLMGVPHVQLSIQAETNYEYHVEVYLRYILL